MTAPQPAQGSTVDYCSRWPDEGHSWASTVHAGTPRITTRSCGSCGYLDVTEVRAALAEAEKRYDETLSAAAEFSLDLERALAVVDAARRFASSDDPADTEALLAAVDAYNPAEETP